MPNIKHIVVTLPDKSIHEVTFIEPKTSDQVEDYLNDIFYEGTDYTWIRKWIHDNKGNKDGDIKG